ncbi:hypothetical protein [uncultured Ruminococcus sp.]|uniref:hypothetical protein n=1 Tax=uncultured Ruminococcus sp. TaxID=165186 RepID=UPI002632037C|nr:hypothetical protein [uncultured Ruminococcus sp.]
MRKKLFFIFLSGFVIIALSIYLLSTHYSNNTIITVNNNYNYNHMCSIINEYYYVKGNDVYNKNGKKVIEELKSPLICAYDNSLYVYSDNSLMRFDNNMNMSEKYEVGAEILSFGIKDSFFCGIDKELEPYIFALDSSEPLQYTSLNNSFNKSYLKYYETDGLKIISSDHDNNTAFKSSAIVSNDSIITRYRNEYGEYIIHNNATELIASSALNTSEPTLVKLSYKTGEGSRSDILSGYYPEDISAINQKIVFIGIRIPSDPHKNIEDMCCVKEHISDIIAVIDANDMRIEKEYKTKKGERILYADTEKAVTYYRGKYITYSTKNWKKIDSHKASEIKKDGSYTFETCGNYIFVFDDNTGKVINKISIE